MNLPANSMTGNDAPRHSLVLLIVGACTGVLMGSLSAFGWLGTDTLPTAVVARVNTTDIETAEYLRALRLFGSEKREAITDPDRTLVLERMIEEELLLQFGVSSGVVRRNSSVREKVLTSILTGLMVELEASQFQGRDHNALLAKYLSQLEDNASIRVVEVGTQK